MSVPNPFPIMSRVTSEEASELSSENKALRRRLEEALLRLEGYEIRVIFFKKNMVSTYSRYWMSKCPNSIHGFDFE